MLVSGKVHIEESIIHLFFSVPEVLSLKKINNQPPSPLLVAQEAVCKASLPRSDPIRLAPRQPRHQQMS